jgi:hypothetical protein
LAAHISASTLCCITSYSATWRTLVSISTLARPTVNSYCARSSISAWCCASHSSTLQLSIALAKARYFRVSLRSSFSLDCSRACIASLCASSELMTIVALLSCCEA